MMPAAQKLSHDFHGYRVPEFKQEVGTMLKRAVSEGIRRVTIITGQGFHSKAGPVLVNVLPKILQQPEYAQFIERVARDRGAFDIFFKEAKELSPTEKFKKNFASLIFTKELRNKLKALAIKGSTKALIELGMMYVEGIGVEQKTEKGIRLISEAAKSDPLAQVILGECYEMGRGVSQNYSKALSFYKQAKKRNYPAAHFALGQMYWLGCGVNRNDQKGIKYITQAADLGEHMAAYNLGYILTLPDRTPAEKSLGLKYLKKAAEAGIVNAQVLFAKHCFFGWSGLQDDQLARQWFTQAALENNAVAQYYLGRIYSEGRGIEPDMNAAFLCYHASAMNGDGEATGMSAIYLLNGIGCIQDIPKAIKFLEKADTHANCVWLLGSTYLDGVKSKSVDKPFVIESDSKRAIPILQRAAKLGSHEAKIMMSRLLLKGENIEKDIPTAVRYLEEAASEDNAHANCVLGAIYTSGGAVPVDLNKGFSFFLKSAELGDDYAMLRVGVAYLQGLGVAKDEKSSAIWIEKAANLGAKQAIFLTGLNYALGRGVDKNMDKAIFWMEKARELHDSEAIVFLAKFYMGMAIKFPSFNFKALDSLKRAAEIGDTKAEYLYGVCLLRGMFECPVDLNKAWEYLKKAAKKNVSEAQYTLGYLCTGKDGFQLKTQNALKWLQRAKEQGHPQATTLLGLMENKEQEHVQATRLVDQVDNTQKTSSYLTYFSSCSIS